MSKEFKLELDKDTARGRYANMAVIAHTKDEFMIDFALAYPGQPPLVSSRIITSPHHAKALLKSLEDNIKRYEERFGEIVDAPKRTTSRTQN
ncbi:MAG: DUF3467 domain-containing protein [Trueperaceae bacterium]